MKVVLGDWRGFLLGGRGGLFLWQTLTCLEACYTLKPPNQLSLVDGVDVRLPVGKFFPHPSAESCPPLPCTQGIVPAHTLQPLSFGLLMIQHGRDLLPVPAPPPMSEHSLSSEPIGCPSKSATETATALEVPVDIGSVSSHGCIECVIKFMCWGM